jgi:hypothetical protein
MWVPIEVLFFSNVTASRRGTFKEDVKETAAAGGREEKPRTRRRRESIFSS